MVRKKKILIIDPNQLTRRLSSDLLCEAGMDIELVPNLSKAFYKIKNTKFNLILTDLFVDLLDTIQMFSRISDTKVMILTNHCEKNSLQEALNNGASGYIIKSHVSSDEFVRLIRESVV